MRLLFQSHTYLAASALVHAAVFSVIVFSSFGISRPNDIFEATVEFQEPVQAPSKPKPAASSPSSADNSKPAALQRTLATKNLEEILKKRTISVKADEDLDGSLIKKRSDLLGYLRANRQTKEAAEKQQVQTKSQAVEKKEKEPLVSASAEEPQAEAGKEVSDKTPETPTPEPAIEQPQAVENKSGIPAAQRSWRKENDLQAYRNVLNKLVTANWTPPQVKVKDYQIIIKVVIDKSGNLVALEHQQSSGLATLDSLAEGAIRSTAPFPGLPASFGADGGTEYKTRFRFLPDQVIY